jgi:RNA polymerase sigma factor (sigma-70 family)
MPSIDHIDPRELAGPIAAFRAGDERAGAVLVDALTGPVRLVTREFLGAGSSDADDVVQETMIAALDYLKRDTEFAGDLVKLAVTIARNRCRDLARWRANKTHVEIETLAAWMTAPERSPLDDLEERDLLRILHLALAELGRDCRHLLRSIYLQGRSVEDLRRELGLTTVQGVYYRRTVCLERARELLNRSLLDRSPGERSSTSDARTPAPEVSDERS